MSGRHEGVLAARAHKSARHLVRAGDVLVRRQAASGALRGNVAPWAGCADPDFHGTLAAVWLWSRAQVAAGEPRFGQQIAAGWAFTEAHWDAFIPRALSASASDEAPYDCAMVLRACLAIHVVTGSGDWRRLGDVAARLLAGFLSDLQETSGRGFLDPGFLAWNLAEYARVVADRGLQASVGRFIDRAFGTRVPVPLADEPEAKGELFDFSSTGATRILAVCASEGETPFLGSWLRERAIKVCPERFLPRAQDENAWNACVAAAAGRAYRVSHEERYLDAYDHIVDELLGRAGEQEGALGRAPGYPSETLATFYFGLALDSMLASDRAGAREVGLDLPR